MAEASNSGTMFTQRQRIAELARQSPQMGFTSLNHLLDLPLLHEAYHRTRKDGATGVDGQTASDLREGVGEESPIASGPSQVRHVPGTARATCAYSERAGFHRNPSDRNPDL